ncbi:hypothetical protein HYS10_00715 [Candidatus Collierbacteria bacterium]|nr:hypothetical protein [Candidatus Collierbacteria bacterium]
MEFSKSKTRRRFQPAINRVVYLVSLIVIVLVVIFIHQTVFQIKSWDCRYGDKECPAKVQAVLRGSIGQSILRLNQNKIKNEIRASGWGEEPKVSFRLPGKIVLILPPLSSIFPVTGFFENINVNLSLSTATTSGELESPTEELELALAGLSGQSFQLLPSGLLVEGEAESLIKIVNPNLSDKDRFLKIHSWIREISAKEVRFKSLYFVGNLVIVRTDLPPEVIFDINKEPGGEILALQQITKTATIKDTKVVDFRYNHPILK